MSTLERAIEIAAQAHKGQTRKGGDPYILHPLRVMFRMSEPEARIVAVLHDVVEESPSWSIDVLRKEGFSEVVMAAIEAVSKRIGEEYTAYLDRVKRNHLAWAVKLADLEDNMNLRELPKLTPADIERASKYHAAYLLLSGQEVGEKADSIDPREPTALTPAEVRSLRKLLKDSLAKFIPRE